MMKFWSIAGVVCAMVLLSGCVRTTTLDWYAAAPGQRSSSGKQVLYNLEGYNCGLYLFYYIPVWSGKTTRPNRKDYRVFDHTVNELDMRRMLNVHLHQLGADDVEDVTFRAADTGAWGLWILWKRSMFVRGVAVKKSAVK